jgi:peptidoglycan/xylan/chitin deacetylase (PgdA/CDA1 family)
MSTLFPTPPAVPIAARRPWPAPAFLRASVGAHALALGAAAALPATWPWALGLVALDHAVLCAAGLMPRSTLLGPNRRRLDAACVARGEIAITLDDGPDPAVTPRVLDLLDEFGAHATFFCIAQRAQANARLAREIVARGHSLQNHTERHRHTFALMGPRAMARELQRGQHCLFDLTGQRPAYFRAPAGLRNPFLDQVLHALELELVSWTRRGFDTSDGSAARVARRLTGGLVAGDILVLHDGGAARGATGEPVCVPALRAVLDAARSNGLACVSLPEALAPSPWPAAS